MAPGFKQIWWTAVAGLEDSTGVYDPNEQVIKNVASIAENGGVAPVTQFKIPAGTPVMLDFEVDPNESYDWYAQRLEWFHEAAPDVKVGIWGVAIGWANVGKQDVANDTPATDAAIDANLVAEAPMINQLDMMTLSCYMLNPNTIDLDLKWISVLAREYHKIYPGKEVMAWTWGAYDSSFNPLNDVLPDNVTQEYLQDVMANCDSMLLWGPDADNTKIKSMAYQMDQTLTASASASSATPSSSIFGTDASNSQDPNSVLT